jgi:osmotically-inducible protein OsmY
MGSATLADRGATEADRTLNHKIRQGLSADSSLASAAKNVHFNSDEGKVTLNGTVATEKEKKDIEAKVEKMAGVKDVDNQLQIAPSASSATGSMGSSSGHAGSTSSGTSGSSSANR